MVGIITNISDRKDTKFLSYNNTLSAEIKFHWQIIAFFIDHGTLLTGVLTGGLTGGQS